MTKEKKVALVTGGSAGLGEDIALELQREGWEVAVCGRRKDKLDAMAARGVGAFACDVGSAEEVASMKEWLTRTYGRLDALVNSAGVALQRTPFLDVPFDQIEQLLRINVLGTLQVTQAFMPLLIETQGSIVTFSSTLAQRPRAGSVVYSATKGAVEAFSRAFAIEAAAHRVRVNCIAPGLVRSDIHLASGMSPQEYEKLLESRAKESPLGRVGEPEDVSALVSFLVSQRAGWMTGMYLPVDGGAMLR